MLKNYFIVSLRGLFKNPLTSFINIFGLSVAIGICLVVYATLSFDLSIDRFHNNKDHVFLVTHFGDMDGSVQEYGRTPRPLANMLHQDFPQIKNVCRIEDGNVVIKRDENVFYETVRYTDHQFLEMFTFPMKLGNSESLADESSIILSEDMAVKYFGDQNPIGKNVLVRFSNANSKLFKVGAVAEKFPDAHIIGFDFLLNFENIKEADPAYDVNDWKSFVNATLIQVDDPKNISAIEQKMEKYKSLQNEVQKDWAISSFAFHSIHNLHLNAVNIRDAISYNYSAEARSVLPIIGFFMLMLACFNYINIAIVSSARRLKEIGVRKVIGASRAKVIAQFLAENVVITTFAVVLGLGLAITTFLPWFIEIGRDPLTLDLNDPYLWLTLVGLLLITALLSGIYPAFYISRFAATKIFRGSVQFGNKNPLTRGLLAVQLVLACISVTGAVMFTQNSTFQSNQSWGYDQKGVIYANLTGGKFEQLEARMLQDRNVVTISGSKDHLGQAYSSTVIRLPGHQYEVHELSVDANYFAVMDLELVSGRLFHERSKADYSKIVVNELFAENILLGEPMGKVVEIDSAKYEIIGVVKNFNLNSFYEKIQPTIFTQASEAEFQFLSMRVAGGTEEESYNRLKAEWSALFPETPFQGGRQEDIFEWFFRDVETAENFMQAVAGVAVLLACLGMYGLVTLNVTGRVKELSIRKILGASVKNIASNISKQYLLLCSIALAIGAPVSYLLIESLLTMLYAYPMPMTYSGMIISLVLLALALIGVVFTQVRRVSKTSPVEGLKVD